MLNPIQTISDEKMSAMDSTASATGVFTSLTLRLGADGAAAAFGEDRVAPDAAMLSDALPAADDPEVKGVPIGFTATSDKPSGVIALVGARVLTMAGMKPGAITGTPGVIENATIVIDGNRISAIGPAGSVQVPAAAKRVDVKGKTIMPGIIDVHAHVGGEGDGLLAESSWPLEANLAFGVTTSHDPSNDTVTVFTNAELIRSGAKLGPRLFSTGTILYGAETPFKAVIDSYEDALSHLRRQKAAGAFSVKSYNQQRRDSRQMIIKAARELEMMVVPEGGSLLYMNQTHIIDGHTGVEHSLPVPHLYKDMAEMIRREANEVIARVRERVEGELAAGVAALTVVQGEVDRLVDDLPDRVPVLERGDGLVVEAVRRPLLDGRHEALARPMRRRARPSAPACRATHRPARAPR